MEIRHKIALFATTYAIILTVLASIDVRRAVMWLSLEVIILPLIYTIGYEMVMEKQRYVLESKLDTVLTKARELETENIELKKELKFTKRNK